MKHILKMEMNSMFEIKYRATKSQSVICKVFDIRNDKAGYPHFLIYYDKQWKWISAKHCEPCETEYVDACVDNLLLKTHELIKQQALEGGF